MCWTCWVTSVAASVVAAWVSTWITTAWLSHDLGGGVAGGVDIGDGRGWLGWAWVLGCDGGWEGHRDGSWSIAAWNGRVAASGIDDIG
jgi:hypothetical protein